MLGIAREKKLVKTYKSKAMAALHRNISDRDHAGAFNKKVEGKIDAACLTPVRKLSPAANRCIRTKVDMSLAILGAHLNVSAGIVSRWEHGQTAPSGPAAELLTLASIHGIDALW